MKTEFNRWLYLGFLLFGLYQLFIQKNFSEAVMMLGIGLAFDPFDQKQTWNDRPAWQRILLIAHLALVFFLFIMAISPDFASRAFPGYIHK